MKRVLIGIIIMMTLLTSIPFDAAALSYYEANGIKGYYEPVGNWSSWSDWMQCDDYAFSKKSNVVDKNKFNGDLVIVEPQVQTRTVYIRTDGKKDIIKWFWRKYKTQIKEYRFRLRTYKWYNSGNVNFTVSDKTPQSLMNIGIQIQYDLTLRSINYGIRWAADQLKSELISAILPGNISSIYNLYDACKGLKKVREWNKEYGYK